MTITLDITIPGKPVGQGSKRHVGGGRMIESSDRLKPWRSDIRHTAIADLTRQGVHGNNPAWPSGIPVSLVITIEHERPNTHFTPKGLRSSAFHRAPLAPCAVPDADKVARAVGDALSGVAWADDKQIVHLEVRRVWTTLGSKTRVQAAAWEEDACS